MPQLGMAQDTGKIVDWRKQPGDAVEAGEILLEVETDKATVEIEAAGAGFLSEVRAGAGADVPVGDVIAVITDQPGQIVAPAPSAAAEPPASSIEPAPSEDKSGTVDADAPDVPALAKAPGGAISGNGRILASPKAKWEAHRRGLNLSDLERLGVPQPFHVSDLDRLTRPEAAEPRHLHHSPVASRVRMTVKTDALSEFLDWSDAATAGAATSAATWSAFASAALRSVGATVPDDGLLVETATPDEDAQPVRVLDADRKGLGQQGDCETGRTPDLRVFDLTGTPLNDYQPANFDGAPVVVITRSDQADQLDITLLFDEAAISLTDATRLLEGLAARVEMPALHLL